MIVAGRNDDGHAGIDDVAESLVEGSGRASADVVADVAAETQVDDFDRGGVGADVVQPGDGLES